MQLRWSRAIASLMERWGDAAIAIDRDVAARFPIRLPLVPSSDDEAPIGFILVGPRPDGTVISKDEQKTLINVSEAIARAVRTVMKREVQEQRIEGLIESTQRRIADIEARLGLSAAARKGGAHSS